MAESTIRNTFRTCEHGQDESQPCAVCDGPVLPVGANVELLTDLAPYARRGELGRVVGIRELTQVREEAVAGSLVRVPIRIGSSTFLQVAVSGVIFACRRRDLRWIGGQLVEIMPPFVLRDEFTLLAMDQIMSDVINPALKEGTLRSSNTVAEAMRRLVAIYCRDHGWILSEWEAAVDGSTLHINRMRIAPA